jgi:hypothetical protein
MNAFEEGGEVRGLAKAAERKKERRRIVAPPSTTSRLPFLFESRLSLFYNKYQPNQRFLQASLIYTSDVS